MASLSKLAIPRERTIRSVLSDLTRLYLSHRTRISRAVWLTLFVALANRIRHAVSEQKAASVRESAQRAARRGTTSSTGGQDAPKKKVELNREFFRSLLRLGKIVVPGWRSQEARLLISHTFFLVLRTLISVRVAEMDGAIVKALVKGNGKEFLKRIVWWMLIAVPATFTNSMVSHLSLTLAQAMLTHTALISPGRAVSKVSHKAHPTHSRQVPFTTHILRHLSPRRPNKERRPAHRC